MATTTARAFLLSRDLSPKHHPPPSLPSSTSLAAAAPFFLRPRYNNSNSNSHHHHHPSWAAATTTTVSCMSSGGGISDDFVSTRKSSLDRGFSVIANMLKRIEPLDNSTISKGVSDSSKDTMKQTISTMLGLLPADDFSVTIRFAKLPLVSLLISAIITGYTLWNVEYRMSLARNFGLSMENGRKSEAAQEESKEGGDVNEGGIGEIGIQDMDIALEVLGDLPQETLDYVQHLRSVLSELKEELKSCDQKIAEMLNGIGNQNRMLEYLRSLDPDMVKELSRPSSVEVEDIIHQLVQSTVQKLFKDEPTLSFMGDSTASNEGSFRTGAFEFCATIGTSRDYLAKLLFWCMLLGHHLRGLENRLQLSCVVGLL